ncbi:hypothetical protein ACH46N_04150 [Streptomyces pristinaespiralis]|uniref:hypothetical protein n=1 Tax=Streptomyces pristinaespiralis TaxID=38300 RepID=UPI0001800C71|nr:hypothetical protein [Streptomyces pristinaespiralis]
MDEIVIGLCRATVPTWADAIMVYLRDPLPVGDEQPVSPFVLRMRRADRLRFHVDDAGQSRAASIPPMDVEAELDTAAELCAVRSGGRLSQVLLEVRPIFGERPRAQAALSELLGDGCSVSGDRSTILTPLRGRRRILGAAVFIRDPDRPAFDTPDLLVAAQLGTQTALGIDKAGLYGAQAQIADGLQHLMLPRALPRPTGVRLASRYLPGAETARVGGDWYDAIPLPGSRVAPRGRRRYG